MLLQTKAPPVQNVVRVKQVSDTGMTARQIMSFTPNYIRFNGGFVVIRQAKKVQDRRTGVINYLCKTDTQVLSEKTRRHEQTIQLLGTATRLSEPRAKCMITCNCEFHLYTCEVALTRQGASKIIYSNGELPYQMNPKCVPLCCKHIYKLFEKILGTGA